MDVVVVGTIVCPDACIEGGWVACKGGKIVAIGVGEPPAATSVLDASGAFVLPGVIDGQTHAGSARGLQGLESTTRSAIAGGVTTIVDMPYDNPEPLSTLATLRAKQEAIQRYAHCDVALYATVMPQLGIDAVGELVDAGVVAFKVSGFESSPTRFPRISTDRILDLFEVLAGTNIPLGLHNEDQEIVLARIARLRNAGRNGIAAHSQSRPEAAELAATAQFLELGAATGAHAHPVHLTSRRGFDLVERYRAEGFRATGELCIHYLWFDPDSDGERLGSLMKVNPPIRPGQIDALWKEVVAGRVAFVSSDHSSWPVDNKFVESIFDAGAGVPGLETLLPAFFTGAQERRLDALKLTAKYLSERPARFFGLWPRKGAISVGADADLAILTPGETCWQPEQAHDELRWSPFSGLTFGARVTATVLGGRMAWDGNNIVNTPGSGIYLPRGTSHWFN